MNAQEAVRSQLAFWHGVGASVLGDCGDALNERRFRAGSKTEIAQELDDRALLFDVAQKVVADFAERIEERAVEVVAQVVRSE